MARTYQIIDEPQPGPMAHIAVQPLWPLLGVMFGGSWLSWPWFVLNAFAVGSPTRRRELALAIGGFAGNAVIGLVIVILQVSEAVPETAVPYLFLVRLVWKLAISYSLYVLQSRTFGVYEYYGGPVQNGLPFLIGGYFVGQFLVARVFEAVPLLSLVLA